MVVKAQYFTSGCVGWFFNLSRQRAMHPTEDRALLLLFYCPKKHFCMQFSNNVVHTVFRNSWKMVNFHCHFNQKRNPHISNVITCTESETSLLVMFLCFPDHLFTPEFSLLFGEHQHKSATDYIVRFIPQCHCGIQTQVCIWSSVFVTMCRLVHFQVNLSTKIQLQNVGTIFQ